MAIARCKVVLLLVTLCVGSSLAQSQISHWNLNATAIQEVLRRFGEDVHSSVSLVTPSRTRELLSVDEDPSSFQSFLSEILGAGWKLWTPATWKLPSFGWADLGDFDVDQNVGDFLNSSTIAALKDVDVHGLYEKASNAVDAICGQDKITLASKVPPSCAGPIVTIDYVPRVCSLNGTIKQIACTTPKLTLTRTPATCVLGGVEGAVFKGKTCRLAGEVGFDISIVAGNAPYVLTPGSLLSKFAGGSADGSTGAAASGATVSAPTPAPAAAP